MKRLGPRDPVPCPKIAGNPTMPAECCVMRTFWKGRGQARKMVAYPVCATCPLGRLRRQKLEASGWKWDEEAWRKRNAARARSEYKARARWLATYGTAPSSRDK